MTPGPSRDGRAEPADPPTSGETTPPPPGAALARLLDRLEGEVVGQRRLLERLVVALLAGGHVLIEGVPGLAKTRSVRALARALDLPSRRIPFTPDLLPSDLTGTLVYRPATGSFDVRPGPIVTSVLVADEINRAPAKVQSALLEAMQEGRVTIGDQPIDLPDPFWVLATQNPIEHEGTYPLPEAQLDRFLLKLTVGYPDRSAELRMLDLAGIGAGTDLRAEPAAPVSIENNGDVHENGRVEAAPTPADAGPILGPDDVRHLRRLTRAVRVAPAIREYAVDLVRATRDPSAYGLDLAPMIELGASPRGTLALVAAARGHALLSGRDYVTPHDVKSLAGDVLRHRIVASYEADAAGLTPDAILGRILDQIRVP